MQIKGVFSYKLNYYIVKYNVWINLYYLRWNGVSHDGGGGGGVAELCLGLSRKSVTRINYILRKLS